jgi:hypothetical protein
LARLFSPFPSTISTIGAAVPGVLIHCSGAGLTLASSCARATYRMRQAQIERQPQRAAELPRGWRSMQSGSGWPFSEPSSESEPGKHQYSTKQHRRQQAELPDSITIAQPGPRCFLDNENGTFPTASQEWCEWDCCRGNPTPVWKAVGRDLFPSSEHVQAGGVISPFHGRTVGCLAPSHSANGALHATFPVERWRCLLAT